MKLVSFHNSKNEERLGFWVDGKVYDANKNDGSLPSTMADFLTQNDTFDAPMRALESKAKTGALEAEGACKMLAPVPHPTSCRDAYAFRQHVQTMRANRGAEMAPEFDEFPVFYFTNHNAVIGEGDVALMADHFQRMDYELELAIVVGKKGRNLSVKDADDHIYGYTIMNDLSARTLQLEEMKLSLGPAKGKDFATVIGPWLVTKDELESKRISTDRGDKYALEMVARINGKEMSRGNAETMNWTFAEILERVSYGVDIYPGDVIGSGTVGTGCLAELNGTGARLAKESGDTFTPTWLEDGDTIDMDIEGLGTLTNKLVKVSDASLLALKKQPK